MKSAPARSLRCRFLISCSGLGGCQVQGAAHKERGRLADIRPGMVHPGVEALLDQLDQAGGHQVVIVHRFGIIADGGRVAHHHEDVAHAQGMRCQQIALHAQQVAPAGGEVQHGFDADLRWIRLQTAQGLMRMRAIGLSATLITSAPASASRLAPASSLWVERPRGGSISTATTNFPAASFCASWVGFRPRPAALRVRSGTASGNALGLAAFGAVLIERRRMAAMCCGVVPQQPPTRLAPASQKASAYSPKYSGLAGYMIRPPTCSGQPALGMTEKRASGTPARICCRMRRIWAGPPEQLTPITSAPASAQDSGRPWPGCRPAGCGRRG